MRRRRRLRPAVLAVGLLLAGCAAVGGRTSGTSLAMAAPAASVSDCTQVWVLSNGFHTSLALPPEAAAAAGLDAGAARWVEVGWGEARAYQAQSMNPLTLLRAVAAPGPTTLFVSQLPYDPSAYGREAARSVAVSREGLRVLLADVRTEARRGADGRAEVLSVAPNGTFVGATGRFGLFRNCNVWVAERLRRAGVPLQDRSALTARGLFRQLDQRSSATCAA